MHLNESNGYWYLRRNAGDGKETVAKLGRHEDRPAIYRPELVQDKAGNLLEALPDESVDLIVTDPPYGIDFESRRTEHNGVSELGKVMDDRTTEFLKGLVEEMHRVLKPDSSCYVFTRWDSYPEFREYFREWFDERTLIIWDKQVQGMGDRETHWAPRHEFIMHCVKGSPKFVSDYRPVNIIEQPKMQFADETQVHPTQKPVKLIEELLEPSSRPGDVVLDPFGGSYATARAAMRTFRRSVACELDPETHRMGVSLTEAQLQDDPEYGVDWTAISNLRVEDTAVLSSSTTPDVEPTPAD